MTLTRGAQRALIATLSGVIVAVYAVAWLAPGIGLYYDDAVALVNAKAVAAGHGYSGEHPPLFPALLALFTLVSGQAQWLKLLPLACTCGWLAAAFRLLRKMGASANGATILIAMTALAPMVVFLGTSLLPEALFGLLATAALAMMLDDRALPAGVLAGLATLTMVAGAPLIVACILTLVARRRLRSALVFAGVAMALTAPWFGWWLAHGGLHASAGGARLAANEKLQVLGANVLDLLRSPFLLLTGIASGYAAIGTVVLLGWALIRRRQLAPDLFVALCCAMAVCRLGPPQRFVAPILPLILWMLWRVFSRVRIQEALAATVIILIGLGVWGSLSRIPATLCFGQFPAGGAAPNDWNEMRKLFAYIRASTPGDAVVMANLDPLFGLETGRKTIRGFTPDGYKLYYERANPAVTPNELAGAIIASGAGFVALTPDRELPGSAAYHRAVEALERGGVVEPVVVPGLGGDYRLLRTGGGGRGR